jgi:hypothetical protein
MSDNLVGIVRRQDQGFEGRRCLSSIAAIFEYTGYDEVPDNKLRLLQTKRICRIPGRDRRVNPFVVVLVFFEYVF